MARKCSILIVGGGTAGWLTAAYLAKYFGLSAGGQIEITLLESPEIGIIGVGEGAFPTMRSTLEYIGIDESSFIREAGATFKQGIRFVDWVRAPEERGDHQFFHPFEPPYYSEDASLVNYWLLQDDAARPPFAEAVSFQHRVAGAQRGPKRQEEGGFSGPLTYAYHFDAARFAEVIAERAMELGVQHLRGKLTGVELAADGSIDYIVTDQHGALHANFYIDCSGFRAELIGRVLGSPLKSVRETLFTNRAVACKIPYARPDAPIESNTIATAHEAGWTWDIGLAQQRGVGCVYSSDYMSDDRAEAILRDYIGPGHENVATRIIPFEAGYREQQWVKNCVAIGLSAGFLEPLEATGVVLIEAAVGMLAEMFPHNGPVDAAAKRFNSVMSARFDNIVDFLKLHYCLSKRTEPFWRDNAAPASISDRLNDLLEQWRYRPPSRFDFTLDLESFAFFNYQYILYGMEFKTDLAGGRNDFPNSAAAEKLFARIRNFGERASHELPSHRDLIEMITARERA